MVFIILLKLVRKYSIIDKTIYYKNIIHINHGTKSDFQHGENMHSENYFIEKYHNTLFSMTASVQAWSIVKWWAKTRNLSDSFWSNILI